MHQFKYRITEVETGSLKLDGEGTVHALMWNLPQMAVSLAFPNHPDRGEIYSSSWDKHSRWTFEVSCEEDYYVEFTLKEEQ